MFSQIIDQKEHKNNWYKFEPATWCYKHHSTAWGRGSLQFIITDIRLKMFTLLQQKKLNLSSRVAGAYKEVANYQDLLLYSPKKQVILILGKTLVCDFVIFT